MISLVVCICLVVLNDWATIDSLNISTYIIDCFIRLKQNSNKEEIFSKKISNSVSFVHSFVKKKKSLEEMKSFNICVHNINRLEWRKYLEKFIFIRIRLKTNAFCGTINK